MLVYKMYPTLVVYILYNFCIQNVYTVSVWVTSKDKVNAERPIWQYVSWFRNQLIETMNRTKESNLVPSIVVESAYHDGFDQALKSPKMTVKAGWKIWTSSKSFSKFEKKNEQTES